MSVMITKIAGDGELTVLLAGRLDTVTSPELIRILQEELDGVRQLTLDLEKVEYISSAGLRILLILQKRMEHQGNMTVRNIPADVMEVFDATGFSDILDIG